MRFLQVESATLSWEEKVVYLQMQLNGVRSKEDAREKVMYVCM
jgi:hypothetical protein